MSVSSKEKRLPHMYWLKKIHLRPAGPWFLFAATKCHFEILSKALTSVFGETDLVDQGVKLKSKVLGSNLNSYSNGFENQP